MNQSLTILILPLDAWGHINPCIGIGQNLLRRGHRVVFAIEKLFEGKLIKYGFEEVVYSLNNKCMPENEQNWDAYSHKATIFTQASNYEKLKFFLYHVVMPKKLEFDSMYNQIEAKVNPDVLLVDNFLISPSIIKNVPWINIFSSNLITHCDNEELPPGGSGLPSNDKTDWNQFREQRIEVVKPFTNKLNEWMAAEGLPKSQENYDIVFPSPFYTFYSYPKELDYNYYKPNWIRFDSFMREEESDFNIDGKFKNNNGKLIYFSLGTLGSCKVDLMKKFVTYFSEIPHRFIISKGPLGNHYDLPDNCWGDNMVSQTKVLPVVDLAIIHGGNNSLCETFYFGKPMIVMPIFGDQIDNAQRVHELGFGIRLNPFHCTKEELNNSIEKLLNDVFLNEKLNKIAERSQTEAKSNRMCELIQQIAIHQ